MKKVSKIKIADIALLYCSMEPLVSKYQILISIVCSTINYLCDWVVYQKSFECGWVWLLGPRYKDVKTNWIFSKCPLLQVFYRVTEST